MFDEKTLVERDGDAAILELFRAWCEVKRIYAARLDGDEEGANAVDDCALAIERRIYKTPASGAAGLALKAYLLIHLHASAWTEDMAALPEPSKGDCLDNYLAQSIIRDTVRFAPELEPLAADFLKDVLLTPQDRAGKAIL
ncbi:MAG TPA: hypothetical protein VJ770_19190 [Stellaceae bacterium]|nr:hypothetical protein [Stellaceae bacterium]